MLKNVRKILVITLSNIGDVVLTTPVIGILKREFPDAGLSIMVSPRAKGLFEDVPGIDLIIYDKHISLKEKLKLAFCLRRRRYDLVVDLRNTIFPFFTGAKYRTSLLARVPRNIIHMKERHLYKLRFLRIDVDGAPFFIWLGKDDASCVEGLVEREQIATGDKIVAISPGARGHLKRWSKEGFAEIADRLIRENRVKIVMVGDRDDRTLISEIIQMMKYKPVDLSGRTNLKELAALLKRCVLHITNDSAPMHIGVALNVPTLAIFGPTDWRKYGPTGNQHFIVYSGLKCSPCELAECRYGHECMKSICPDEVYQATRRMLDS